MAAGESYDDQTRSFIALTMGTIVSHYRIIRKIGSGGMGEVYLAEDTQLDREVALKFLPPDLCRDEEFRARFKREAQAAAKLSHPSIIHVYEVSEYHGGPFFAMEHVEGQSLREFSSDKELSIEQILELGIQVCEGLSEAHQKGITHRDIKPSNILIDSHRRAKIVDFGLASVVGTDQLTKTGSTLGTIGYMSPEQVQGREIDHRSDLFSLGVVLYEVITKRNPFERDSEAATLRAISDDLPEPLARFKSGLPDGLQDIIDKALEKDVRTRYQHADGMLSDLLRLKRLFESGQSSISAASPTGDSSRRWRAAAVVFVLATIAVLIMTRPWLSDTSSNEPREIMLAVLPFENLGQAEDGYFADGITDEITSRLAAVSNLGVISRTSTRSFKGTSKKLQQIAAELGVEYILEGSIRWDKSGDIERVLITPQLIRASDDTHVWSDRYERPLEDVFAVQRDIAANVVEALNINLFDADRESLSHEPTGNLEAYDFYLRGKEYWRSARDDNEIALGKDMFERAIALDSQFALAHAALSQHYSGSYQENVEGSAAVLSAAKTHADVAVSLAPKLPESHVALGFYYFRGLGDYDAALKEFSIAREYNPNHSDVLRAMSIIERIQGRWSDAYNDAKRSVTLDPHSWHKRWQYAYTCTIMRRFEEANRILDESLALYPQNTQLYSLKARAAVMEFADPAMVREIIDEMSAVSLDSIEFRHLQRVAAILEGDYDGLIQRYQDISENALTVYPPQQRPLIRQVTRCMDMGDWHLLTGNVAASHAYYDSALTILRQLSDDIEIPVRKMGLYFVTAPKHGALGLITAALGLKEEALREGWKLVESLPCSVNAITGPEYELILAEICSRVGEYGLAIERLENLLSIPSELTVALAKTRPAWYALRHHQGFHALIEKYDKDYGT